MLLYWGKQFNATAQGQRLVEVECEKCGCEYAFTLSRIGKAVTEAPYSIGNASAQRRAESSAQKDLAERLINEAELVPCPACNWINESLVQGFRLSRFRQWARNSSAFAFVGTACCVVAWHFLSMNPSDQGTARTVLVGGSALFIAVPIVFVLIRNFLRRRIQPNKGYPAPPYLPVATPPALLHDESSSSWRPVWNAEASFEDKPGWVRFQIGRDDFPQVCGVCDSPAAELSDIEFGVTETAILRVPQCGACRRRSRMKAVLVFVACMLAGPCAAWIIGSTAGLDLNSFWCSMGAATILASFIGAWLSVQTTKPLKLSFDPQPNGALRIRFKNAAYAETVRNHIAEQLAPTRHAITRSLELM